MDGTGKQPRWPMVKLGDVCEMFIDGDWIESKDQSETGLRLIQTGNIGVGVFKNRAEKARYITENTFSKLKCTEVLHGDCLISRLPDPVGRACIVPDIGERMITSVDCSILRLKKNLIFDKYLILYTQTEKYAYDISKKTSGSTRTRISRTNLGEITLPLPPLAEQQRIVARLDAAFAAIDEASAAAASNARNARALFESYLDQVFSQRGAGWVERRLGEVASTSLGKMLDKMKNMGELQPYLRNINVRWFYFDLSDVSQMPFLQHELQRYAVKKGDVLVCEGGYPGRAAIWDYDEEIYFQKALHRVRFHDVSLNEWFVYYLWLLSSTGSLSKLFTGTGIQHLTGVTLSKLIIPIPPRAESAELISKIKQMHSQTTQLTTIYERKVAALAELKQSLLAEVFGA